MIYGEEKLAWGGMVGDRDGNVNYIIDFYFKIVLVGFYLWGVVFGYRREIIYGVIKGIVIYDVIY